MPGLSGPPWPSVFKYDESVDEQPLAVRDFQLNEALNLLKGLYILQARS